MSKLLRCGLRAAVVAAWSLLAATSARGAGERAEGTLSLDRWTHVLVDDQRGKWGDTDEPGWLRYFGLAMEDVTGDGYRDIVAGRYFYRNPGGDLPGRWKRVDLGANVDGMLFVDVDGDALGDIIATALPAVYWVEAKNLQGTDWKATRVGTLPETGHVNGQGYMLGQIRPGGRPEVILACGDGIHCLEIPAEPSETPWPSRRIARGTMDEGIGVGDVDGDSDVDIVAGWKEGESYSVRWYANPADESTDWNGQVVGKTRFAPDRIVVADINGDALLDVVVSEERYPGPDPDASLYWFQQERDGTPEFRRHIVVTEYSLNNLDVADMDRDGDPDIITCEHKGPKEKLQIWENDGRGGFTGHLLDEGKESHLGARVADMDGDGDLDIVSAAWDEYRFLHLWRNDALTAGASSGVDSGVLRSGPVPGDVFREYLWFHEEGDAGSALRVGGKQGQYHPDRGSAHDYINAPVTLDHEFDLESATRAEVVIEKILCHDGTRGLAIRVNGQDWIPVPECAGIPIPQWEYQHHTYPVVAIPLEQLKSGRGNCFQMRVDSEHPWNWPQNLINGVHFRVYYDPERKPHPTGRVTSPAAGHRLPRQAALSVEAESPAGRVVRVDWIGHLEDVNFEGDGNYLRWHYHYCHGRLINHIGSSEEAPFRLTWDTTWVPDQPQPFRIAARILDASGLIFMTPAVDGLTLHRPGSSVELCKPYAVPKKWVTRAGEKKEHFDIRGDPDKAVAAQLVWSSWSPGYMNGLRINGVQVFDSEGPKYQYYAHRVTIRDVSMLKKGRNTLTTGKTPLHDGKMVHGMEVNWPGIMVLVRYRS